MHDINLIHPLTAAIATGATIAVVDDIDTAIAWLDMHGGTQSLTRTGDTIAGVFLGIEFSIRLVAKSPAYVEHLEPSRAKETHGIHRRQGRRHQGQSKVARLSRRPQSGVGALG
jgi:hypothetical protein